MANDDPGPPGRTRSLRWRCLDAERRCEPAYSFCRDLFDQLVGVWIYRDNMRKRVVPTLVQSLILFLTLMFGPVGFLVYYVIRVMQKRRPAPSDGLATSVLGDPFD